LQKVCLKGKSNYLCRPERGQVLRKIGVEVLEKIKFKNYFKKDLHDKKEVVLLHPL